MLPRLQSWQAVRKHEFLKEMELLIIEVHSWCQ